MMAEFRFITDPRQATGTDCVEIALVQSKIGVAISAGLGVTFARSATRGTADDCSVLAFWLRNFDPMPAMAMKKRTDFLSRRIVLSTTVFAGYKQAYQIYSPYRIAPIRAVQIRAD